MGDTFKENSVNNINRKKYESNYEKIFGKKEKKNREMCREWAAHKSESPSEVQVPHLAADPRI